MAFVWDVLSWVYCSESIRGNKEGGMDGVL